MEKYLLQVLESNNRVIVPEFGAFIIKQKNPLNIIFNEFLQYNDGMLVDAISKNEGIDRDSAKKKIDEFIVKMNSALDKEGRFSLTGIGVVTKGTSGKISLEKEEPKKAGKKTIKTEETPEKQTAQPRETKKVAAKKPAEAKDETIEMETRKPGDKEQKVEEKTKISEDVIKPDKEAEKKEEKPKVQAPSERKPEQKISEKVEVKTEEKVIQEPPRTTQPAYTTSAEYESNKRGRTKLIVWLIIIIIVNGALIGYFFYSEEISALFTKKSDAVIEAEPYPGDQLLPETEPAAEPYEDITTGKSEKEPVETVKTTPTQVSSGPRFYIVAGVFREESNADNLVNELRQKGYNAEKFGKIGSLHAVSYDVFSTKADADNELRKIQSEVDPEAWIREEK